LEDVMDIQVPRMDGLRIPCEVKVGLNWGEMRKI